ncbi:MAG: phage tail sheath subtilisin-like domain-containing protein [Rhodocyclaceae bacterium]|nr:phage tail sheath subtilisin-like domain-containing protein [Rhodocyclaceae bacterium]
MPSYLHPGVYIEEIPSGSRPIEGVGTSTACFIGYVERGPVGQPVLVSSFDDYQRHFGGLREDNSTSRGDDMGHAVSAFFTNGGAKAYIVRSVLGDGSALPASGSVRNVADTADLLTAAAADPGSWANGMEVRIEPRAVGGTTTFNVSVGRTTGDSFAVDELFTDLVPEPGAPTDMASVINADSTLVSLALAGAAAELRGRLTAPAGTAVRDSAGASLLAIDGAGTAAHGQRVRFTADTSGSLATFTVEVGSRNGSAFTATETFTGLVPETADPNTDLVVQVNTNSTLVALTLPGGGEAALRSALEAAGTLELELRAATTVVTLGGGTNGSAPALPDYQSVLTALLKVRDINMLLLPGVFWGTAANQAILDAAIAHCETIRNRMVLVDTAPGDELTDEGDVNALGLPTSTYAVTYYPWPRITNPFHNPDSNPAAPRTLLVSPGAAVAGLWAKTDNRRGVWKAPAGIEFPLLGTAALEFVVEDPEQDYLNPAGVNALRRMPGFGPVVWGTRTRSTRANPEWRYVPIRRTAMFIEESVFNGIQWAVFEPNDHRLWSSLRTNIESFMNGLFRVGAFQGEKTNDAYFVRCGLGQTMTQGDIDRGQVIVLVGFAPLKPAEFVIVRIQQKVAQQ